MNQSIFGTPGLHQQMCPEKEPTIRYAKCGFVDMGAVKRAMLRQVRCGFATLPKRRRAALVDKQFETIGNMRQNGFLEKSQPRDVATFTARWCQNRKVIKTIGGSNALTPRNESWQNTLEI